jgi:hypothetical protein
VDGTTVYWIDYDSDTEMGAVMKVASNGGAPTVLAPGQDFPSSIAVDGTSVYWTTSWPISPGPDGGARGSVMKMSIDGGTPIALASSAGLTGIIYDIAVDATSVYWVSDSSNQAQTDVSLVKVPKDGGTPINLASLPTSPNQIAVGATSVYVTFYDLATVMSVPTDGGIPTTLASTPPGNAGAFNPPYGIAVDATSVPWTNYGGGVMKVPIGGGTPTTVASSPYAAMGIAVDQASVYWIAGGRGANDGAVLKVPLGGGTPLTLAPPGNAWLAVDATSVYWTTTNANNSMIMKLTPK